MDWRPYQDCCRTRALDPTVAVCPDCGHPLLRCRGFRDCRAILSPGDHCPVHVAPRLNLRQDTGLDARVSDRVDLPLVLANASGCGAPLRIKEITRVASAGEPEPVRLYWDRLPAGEEREISVDSGPLQSGGRTQITIRIVLAAGDGRQEEDFAFAAHVPIRVEGPTAERITQHIHVEGSHFAAGAAAVVQTGPSIHGGPGAPPPRGESLVALKLERAEAFELRRGIRGYAAAGLRIPRTVAFRTHGFPGDDAPVEIWRPFLEGTEVRLGRNGRRAHEGNPRPSDICLRVYDASGALDRDRSYRISGTHGVLFLANDRLVLSVRGRNGLWLNGRKLEEEDTAVLEPGARARVFEPGHGGPELRVEMTSRADQVSRIDLVRQGESHVLP